MPDRAVLYRTRRVKSFPTPVKVFLAFSRSFLNSGRLCLSFDTQGALTRTGTQTGGTHTYTRGTKKTVATRFEVTLLFQEILPKNAVRFVDKQYVFLP